MRINKEENIIKIGNKKITKIYKREIKEQSVPESTRKIK
jgi:hypothetical protein